MPVHVARINLWSDPVGAVAWDDDRGFATFEYDPYQMTINGKSDGFEPQDFIEVAKQFRLKKAKDIIADVGAAVRRWPDFAKEVGVKRNRITEIASTHRLYLVPK